MIRNDHIVWDGNPIGLAVVGMTDIERHILCEGSAARPFLIAALSDESRFAVAHVLLTQIQGGSLQSGSAAEWNRLKVDLHADGRVEIPVEQQTAIQAIWTQK